MEAYQIFRRMIIEAEVCQKVPRPTREALVKRLTYFETQSKCSGEYRAPVKELQFAWKDVDLLKGQKQLFKWANERDVQAVLGGFLGIPAEPPARLQIVKPSSAPPKPYDLFTSLLYTIESCKLKGLIPKEHYSILKYGILVLRYSTEISKAKRNHEENRTIWKDLWPLLEKYRLMESLRKEPANKDAINYFLKGTL